MNAVTHARRLATVTHHTPQPRWLWEGMKVMVHYDATRCVRVTVVTACGDGGRVVNEKHGVDRWVLLHDMYEVVEEDVPH